MNKFLKIFFTFLSLTVLLSPSTKAQEKGDPPPAMPGLEIKRSYLIKQMQSSDSSMVFKQDADINGEQNYTGIDKDGSAMQFIGQEDYLKKAAFTFKFTTNPDVNLLQYKRMTYFAFLMGGNNCLKWVEQCSGDFLNDKTKALTNSKTFDFNRKGTYSYNPADKAIVLTFTEW